MDYLSQCVSTIQDQATKAKLLKVIEKWLPALKSLPASMLHHGYAGGAYDFACKVLQSAIGIHETLLRSSGGKTTVTKDDLVFVASISCLDIPFRFRRGEAKDPKKPEDISFERIGDWAVDPAFFIASELAEEGVYISAETYHALSFRDGSWSEFHTKRSVQDLSPLASILHSAFMLAINFPQSVPADIQGQDLAKAIL